MKLYKIPIAHYVPAFPGFNVRMFGVQDDLRALINPVIKAYPNTLITITVSQ
jgi:hypothetical protein